MFQAARLLGDPSMQAPVLEEVHKGVDRKSGDTKHMSHLQEIYYRACGVQSICRMNGFCLCSHVFMVYGVFSTSSDLVKLWMTDGVKKPSWNAVGSDL